MTQSGSTVKRLIWVYFFVLILEGAFRKWILPGLSSPLLLTRDPVVLLIYLFALAEGRFPRNAFIPWIVGLAGCCFLTAFAGAGTLKVSLFGLHANFLHLPLIFVMAEYFDLSDVRKMGKWLLLILLPMTLLAVLQFRAGPDARINAGAGGEIGAQIYAAAGKVRASGTFSFVTGFVSFLALVSSFLFYDFLQKNVFPKLLVFAALPAMVLSLGVSGSRSAVLTVLVVVLAGAVVCLRRWETFGSAFFRVFLVLLVFAGLSQTSLFREGIEVQRERFESGGGVKSGIVERYFESFAQAYSALETAPVLGYGLGTGTSAGAALMVHERAFLLAEGEWPRVILELGPILGMLYLLLRIAIIVYALVRGWSQLELGQTLPILLLGMSGLEMLNGQFGQTTSLGFAALGMGLTLASTKPVLDGSGEITPETPVEPAPRGRSRYAEALHGNPGR